MYTTETKLRVRYAETDKMGYVYYGNYASFYEVGRVEAMRGIGMSYLELEKMGFMMPVLTLNIKYIRPAFYDDLLTIRTYVKEIPKTRMTFEYEVYNEDNVLLNFGSTSHPFVNIKNGRPCAAPEIFMAKFLKHF